MKISGVTSRDRIDFFFGDGRHLTIHDSGEYSWSDRKYSDRSVVLTVVLLCLVLDYISFLFHAEIIPGSWRCFFNLAELGVILFCLFEFRDRKTDRRHAVEHILITAAEEDRPEKLDVDDRMCPSCGTTLAVYGGFTGILSVAFLPVFSVTVVFCLAVVLGFLLRKWKRNPFVRVSLFIQRYTVPAPEPLMLRVYHCSFLRALSEKHK